MIFSEADHISQIIAGTKWQTRRSSLRYQVGKTYSIQPKRTAKGIQEGRIRIIEAHTELKGINIISRSDALAEGKYTPREYEKLYEKLNPNWVSRWAYTFEFIPTEASA